MDFKKLTGKEVLIDGKTVSVSTIEEQENPFTGDSIYLVNGIHRYSSMSIALALSLINESVDDRSWFVKKFGVFTYTELENQLQGFGFSVKLREYGYDKASLRLSLNLGRKTYNVELVFNCKKEFEKGILPYPNSGSKQVF